MSLHVLIVFLCAIATCAATLLVFYARGFVSWLLAVGLICIVAALLSVDLTEYSSGHSTSLDPIEVIGGILFGILAGALIFLVRR